MRITIHWSVRICGINQWAAKHGSIDSYREYPFSRTCMQSSFQQPRPCMCTHTTPYSPTNEQRQGHLYVRPRLSSFLPLTEYSSLVTLSSSSPCLWLSPQTKTACAAFSDIVVPPLAATIPRWAPNLSAPPVDRLYAGSIDAHPGTNVTLMT